MACCCVSLRIGALVIGSLGFIASFVKAIVISFALASKLYSNRALLLQPIRNDLRDTAIELVLHIVNIIFALMLVYGVRKERWCPINASFIYSTVLIILLCGATTLENRLGIKVSVDTSACEFLAFLLGAYFIYGGYCATEEFKSGLIKH